MHCRLGGSGSELDVFAILHITKSNIASHVNKYALDLTVNCMMHVASWHYYWIIEVLCGHSLRIASDLFVVRYVVPSLTELAPELSVPLDLVLINIFHSYLIIISQLDHATSSGS